MINQAPLSNTIPLDNSAQRDKTTVGVPILLTVRKQLARFMSQKLNSRKQKCGNQTSQLDEARSAVSKGASP